MKIIVIGLSGSGKSTFISKLCDKQVDRITPTTGIEKVKHISGKGKAVQFWEISGIKLWTRNLLSIFYASLSIILIVDSSQPNQFVLTKQFYTKFLDNLAEIHLLLSWKVIVVFTKVDLSNMSLEKLKHNFLLGTNIDNKLYRRCEFVLFSAFEENYQGFQLIWNLIDELSSA